MHEFTDEDAIVAGGWDPRFARVLAKVALGSSAIAIIDSNGGQGDQPVYENLDAYRWQPGVGWSGWSSSGGLSSGWVGGLAYASGTGTAGESVVVAYRGENHRTEVAPTGYWLVVIEDRTPDDSYPIRVT
jgi:hypothetical protein